MVIKQDILPNGYYVSTVWRNSVSLALDQGISNISTLIGYERGKELGGSESYETMVFRHEHGEVLDWFPLEMARYENEEDARVGHEEMSNRWRGGEGEANNAGRIHGEGEA